MIKLYLSFLLALPLFLFSQHENDNWLFGNNKWTFDNSTPNGFTHTTNLSPSIRYVSSVVSDKNTGELLFFSNGYTIYNKNSVVMDNGNDLFGTPNTYFQAIGNPSDQSSIIVPLPNSNSLYYVFYINGNRNLTDQNVVFSTTSFNYGLRYAIVDMSLNGGLGKVISKNNVLFSDSPTNALTSTFSSDGNSYWIVTANNGNFLSYKLSASGLNTTPVVSTGANYGSFIKISPNAKKLLTRTYRSVWLYDFNNSTGSITNPFNIIPVNNYATYYNEASGAPNSAEFSPDSNIVYFIGAEACLCLYPAGLIGWSGLAMYNISTGSLFGVNQNFQYDFPLYGLTASLQLSKNGKIYLIYNARIQDDGFGFKEVKFGNYMSTYYQSYDWGVINNPNIWNTSTSPLNAITPPINAINGFSFPQLIPSLDNVNTCPDVLYITPPITASQDFQAGQSIYASSAINDNLMVNYKAGQEVSLLPGFHVRGEVRGQFRAYIDPCTITSRVKGYIDKIKQVRVNTNELFTSAEVKIYPNPASTFVKIDSDKNKVVGWVLYDLSGKVVLNGNNTTVTVENLPKSTYLLVIKLDNGTNVSKKIIIQ